MTEIVKVQRPLSSNAPGAPWLVYDKARTFVERKPEAAIPDAISTEMGDDPKGYFEATWSCPGGWSIGARIKDRKW